MRTNKLDLNFIFDQNSMWLVSLKSWKKLLKNEVKHYKYQKRYGYYGFMMNIF